MLSTLVISLTFQPPPGSQRPFSRVGDAAMSHQLNNYVLDGPLVPLGNQVLVKLNKVEDKTDGGLFVPGAASEKPKEGTVVAAGPGVMDPESCKLIANPFQSGDLVLLSDFVGEKVDYDSEKHIFLSANDVLGKFAGDVASVDGFQPALDRLLVTTPEAATETSSGIALAGLEDEESNQGEVVAVGPGKANSQGGTISPGVSVGDNVLYEKLGACEAVLEGKKYKLVPASECLAKW